MRDTYYIHICLPSRFSSPSLGCKAIFLLGGKSRQDPPVAMFLRSGDVVLMAGEARECFHGNVFFHIYSYIVLKCYLCRRYMHLDIRFQQCWVIHSFVERSLNSQNMLCGCLVGVPRIFIDVETDETSLLEKQFSNQDDVHFLEYIRTSRININIRQVFWLFGPVIFRASRWILHC